MKNLERWIFLIPLPVIAWLAVLFIGMLTHGYAERALCPPDDIVSGYCNDEGVQSKISWLIPAFSGLSAFAVVLTAFAVAPTDRVVAAWLALLIGSLLAAYMLGLSLAFFAALAGGLLPATALTMYQRGKKRVATDIEGTQ